MKTQKYTFDEYQKESKQTALYESIGEYRFIYPTLGLAGETGEVVEKIKKAIRNKGGKINKEDLSMIEKEIGDVLWYLSQLVSDLGLSLEDVAKHNIEKVFSRYDRGVIKSEGDVR